MKEFRELATEGQFLISNEQRQCPQAIHRKPEAAEDATETIAEPDLEP